MRLFLSILTLSRAASPAWAADPVLFGKATRTLGAPATTANVLKSIVQMLPPGTYEGTTNPLSPENSVPCRVIVEANLPDWLLKIEVQQDLGAGASGSREFFAISRASVNVANSNFAETTRADASYTVVRYNHIELLKSGNVVRGLNMTMELTKPEKEGGYLGVSLMGGPPFLGNCTALRKAAN
jgi:hypothetical protein